MLVLPWHEFGRRHDGPCYVNNTTLWKWLFGSDGNSSIDLRIYEMIFFNTLILSALAIICSDHCWLILTASKNLHHCRLQHWVWFQNTMKRVAPCKSGIVRVWEYWLLTLILFLFFCGSNIKPYLFSVHQCSLAGNDIIGKLAQSVNGKNLLSF